MGSVRRLKEPLRGIEGFSRILTEEYGAVLDDTGRRYLDMVVGAAERMRRLIDDLLAFARAGRTDSRPGPVPLGEITKEVLDGLRYSVQEAGATVLVPSDLPTITGHGVLIRELLGNLVGNALKYRRRDVSPHIEIGWRRVSHPTGPLPRSHALHIDRQGSHSSRSSRVQVRGARERTRRRSGATPHPLRGQASE